MPTNNERIITYPNYIREYNGVCKRELSSMNRLKEYLESNSNHASRSDLENIPVLISKLTKRIELLSALEATF